MLPIPIEFAGSITDEITDTLIVSPIEGVPSLENGELHRFDKCRI